MLPLEIIIHYMVYRYISHLTISKQHKSTHETYQDGIRIPPFNVTGITFLKWQIKF